MRLVVLLLWSSSVIDDADLGASALRLRLAARDVDAAGEHLQLSESAVCSLQQTRPAAS